MISWGYSSMAQYVIRSELLVKKLEVQMYMIPSLLIEGRLKILPLSSATEYLPMLNEQQDMFCMCPLYLTHCALINNNDWYEKMRTINGEKDKKHNKKH